MKNPKQYEDDDGRVIANMDVEGMPWHQRRSIWPERAASSSPQGQGMSRSEARQYTWYSLGAAAIIVGVFSLTWILFTLFCLYIWFQ
jgi:hypothetical protein